MAAYQCGMSTAAPAPPAPVPDRERIDALDAIRGVALGGILLINLTAFAAPFGPPGFRAGDGWADRVVDGLLLLLVESKFFCLFSLLFGAGFAVQLLRAEGRGGFAGRFTRRLLALAGFGAAHILLLWEGDILLLYAVVGAILPLFRNAAPRRLLAWAAGLLAVPLAVYAVAVATTLVGRVSPDGAAEMAKLDGELVQAFAAARESASTSPPVSYPDTIGRRLSGYAETGLLLATRIPTVLAMFLLGLYAGRQGVLTGGEERLRRVRGWGLVVGLAASGLVVAGVFTLPPASALVALFFNQAAAGPVLALGYGSALLLLARRPEWGRVLGVFAPVGRMALTNYLAQSVICSVLFAGWGLRLGQVVPPAAQLAMATGVFTAQVVLSALWLRAFHIGPAEWVWRSLTYGAVQPLRRSV